MNQLNLTFEPQLDEIARRVLIEIKRRPGRDAAIPMRELAWRIFEDDSPNSTRRIQNIVPGLIDLGYPIGSATGKPNGYYWIIDLDEASAAEKQLMHRIQKLSRRAAMLRKHFPALAGQQEL